MNFCSQQKKSFTSSLTLFRKSRSNELDSRTASFFYENAIPFNVADSPSFAAMIEEAMTFRQQNPLQSYEVPLRRKLSGELLDKSYESTELAVLPIIDEAKNMEQQLHLMDGVMFTGALF